MNTEQKFEMLLKYNKKDFTKKFLIPLYKEMGFENVEYTHCVLEYGKDVIYSEIDKYGNKEDIHNEEAFAEKKHKYCRTLE